MTESEAYAIILADCLRDRQGSKPAAYVGYYCHFCWPIPTADVSLDVQRELFRRAEAEALSTVWGAPVRVFSLGEGNGHGTWEVRPDVGPICAEEERVRCVGLREWPHVAGDVCGGGR